MSDSKKQYNGDKVAEFLAVGDYEGAVEAAEAGSSEGILADQLSYADPVNKDRVFAGLPLVLGAIQDIDIEAYDIDLYVAERLSGDE